MSVKARSRVSRRVRPADPARARRGRGADTGQARPDLRGAARASRASGRWWKGALPLALSLAVPAVLCRSRSSPPVWRHPLPADLRGIEAIASIALVFRPQRDPDDAGPHDARHAAHRRLLRSDERGHDQPASPSPPTPTAGLSRRISCAPGSNGAAGWFIATAVLALLLPSGMPAQKAGTGGHRPGRPHRLDPQAGAATAGRLYGADGRDDGPRHPRHSRLARGRGADPSRRSRPGASRPDPTVSPATAPWDRGIVVLAGVLGAVSLLTYVLILQGKPRDAWRLGSVRRVLLALLTVGTLYAIMLLHRRFARPFQTFMARSLKRDLGPDNGRVLDRAPPPDQRGAPWSS